VFCDGISFQVEHNCTQNKRKKEKKKGNPFSINTT